MIVNNFETFPRERKTGEFYFVQIIERAKDNPDKKWLNGGNSCRVLKSYSISSLPELTKRTPIIKEYCEKYNARCYIHPARRSEYTIACTMVQMLWEYLTKHNHNLSRLYDSACGHDTGVERLWIIDIDDKDIVIDDIMNPILVRSLWKKEIRRWVNPTLNGYHIITTPFDLRILDWKYDIHKNNPTLLYCNIQTWLNEKEPAIK